MASTESEEKFAANPYLWRINKRALLWAINKHGYCLQSAKKRLRDDKAVVMAAVTIDGHELKFASDRLKASKRVVRTAVKNRNFVMKEGSVLKYASESLRNDLKTVRIAISVNPDSLRYASSEIQDDEETVLYAVAKDGLVLEHASARLQNNLHIVETAMLSSYNGRAIIYASPEIRMNTQFVVRMITQRPMLYQHLSNEEKSIEVTIAAVRNNGRFLCYAPEELKDNIEVVKIASESHVDALDSASERARQDHRILEAIAPHIDLLEFKTYIPEQRITKEIILNFSVYLLGKVFPQLHEAFRFDRDIIETFAPEIESVLAYTSAELRDDKEIALLTHVDSFQYLSERLRADKEVVMYHTRKNGLQLRYASEECQDCEEIAFKAVRQNPCSLEFCSPRLRNNKDLVTLAVSTKRPTWPPNGEQPLRFVSEELRNNDEVVKAACRKNGNSLPFASRRLQECRENVLIALESLRRNYQERNIKRLYKTLPMNIQSDPEIAKIAVHMNATCVEYVPETTENHKLLVAHVLPMYVCDVPNNLKVNLLAKYRTSKKLFSLAISRNPQLFVEAHESLRDDYEFVMEQLLIYPGVFPYVSENLKLDKEIIAQYMMGSSLQNTIVQHALAEDKDFALTVCIKNGVCLMQFPLFQGDEDVAKAAVLSNGLALPYLNRNLKEKKEYCLLSVKQNGLAFNYVTPELRKDHDISLAAIENAGDEILPKVSSEYKENVEFARLVLYSHPECITWFSPFVQAQIEKLASQKSARK